MVDTKIDLDKLPLREQHHVPGPNQYEKAIRALAPIWSRQKATRLIDRLTEHNLIDLQHTFVAKTADTPTERLMWWIAKFEELFPGIPPLAAANTFDRLEALSCLHVRVQQRGTRKEFKKPAQRLTFTQEQILRGAAKEPHGFFVHRGTKSGGTTWKKLISMELARESTSRGLGGEKTYITPLGRRALEDMDKFRLEFPDDYARGSRADVNIMQLSEIRFDKLPLGTVSPVHDFSRPRVWEDKRAGPEDPAKRAARIKKLHAERDKAHTARKADPFEGTDLTKKKLGRPKGSKHKKNLKKAPARSTSSKLTPKGVAKKSRAKKKKATTASPRKTPGESKPLRVQGNPERLAAAQAALAKLKTPVDPFED